MTVIMNFLDAMKFLSLEDLGFRESEGVKSLESLSTSSSQFLSVGRCLESEWRRLKRRRRRRRSPFELTKTNYTHTPTNTLEQARTRFLDIA